MNKSQSLLLLGLFAFISFSSVSALNSTTSTECKDFGDFVDHIGKTVNVSLDDEDLPTRPGEYDRDGFEKAEKEREKAKKLGDRKLAKVSTMYITVAKDGSGQFKKVQAAIDSVPKNNKNRVVIYVKRGIYSEKVKIPSSKPFITLKGDGYALTYIQWGDTASTVGPDGDALSTYGSASVAVEADNFIAVDISFKNTAPPPPNGAVGKQAVALRIQGDMAAFYSCGFYGAQDTLYDREGRHYYYRCYIEGSIDFIFGDARSLFVKCHIHSIASPYGSIAAQKRLTPKENTGYSFVYCVVTGSGYIFLGRAWGGYSRIVYLLTYFDNIINPQGWNDWNIPANDKTVYYGEYQCFGPGADQTGRVPYSIKLTKKQAKPFLSLNFIDGYTWVNK